MTSTSAVAIYKRMKKDDVIDVLVALKEEKQSDLISWDKQLLNLKARVAIHNYEFSIAIEDIKELGKRTRVIFEDLKEQLNIQ